MNERYKIKKVERFLVVDTVNDWALAEERTEEEARKFIRKRIEKDEENENNENTADKS